MDVLSSGQAPGVVVDSRTLQLESNMSQRYGVKVFLDDLRPAPSGWTLVRWPEEAIEILKMGEVDELSLDHDLGDDEHGTGYDVLTWLEEAVATQGFVPPQRIVIHSANTSARQKMQAAIESIRRFENR